jgi:hypothetical protein
MWPSCNVLHSVNTRWKALEIDELGTFEARVAME